MNDKEKFEEETLAEFIEMTGIPKEKIIRYGKVHSIKFNTLGETYEYEFKTSGMVVELYGSSLPVLYFPKKPHDISEPVLSHSENSGLIYVYFGEEKYEITKYAIEAVEAIKALEQESTTKNCRTCKNFDSHHGICEICKDNKCWTEREPRWIPVSEKLPKYEAKVITRGNCMMCGKELTEGLFFCKECEEKAIQGRKCGEQMDFPNTFDEFVKDYGFKDKDEVYTNGSELIPVFRVKQWLEHISSVTPVIDKLRAEIIDTGAYEQETHGKTEFLEGINYCLSVIDKYIGGKEQKDDTK